MRLRPKDTDSFHHPHRDTGHNRGHWRPVDRFQLVVNGWEVVNAYSELVDPVDQAERFKQQANARAQGDTETMEVDNDFLQCMEFGMPPMSGWGMGVDRIVALLTNASTLRDVVLFPLMRPEYAGTGNVQVPPIVANGQGISIPPTRTE